MTTGWSAFMSGLILVFLDRTVGLRVPLTHETIGLDIAQLHDTIIDTPTKKLKLLIKKTVTASLSSHKNNDDDLDGMGSVTDDLDMKNRGESEGEGGGGSSAVGEDDGEEDGTVNDTNRPVLYTQKSILSGND